MEIPLHPSIGELKEALHQNGVELSCTICGKEEFSIEEADILRTGAGQYYGNRRLPRAQVVCENCGHVMSFEIEKLQVRRA